jgi:hypothetical protein
MSKGLFLCLLILCFMPYLFDVVTCEESSFSPLHQQALVDGENADPADDDQGPSYTITSQVTHVRHNPGPASTGADDRITLGPSAHLGLPLTSRPPPLT